MSEASGAGAAMPGISRPLRVESAQTLGFCEERLSRASDILRGEIARGTMPGAVVMIGRRGAVAHLEAMGVQAPGSPAPMRTDSLFRIFSMTKPVVSLAVMMLIEQGRLRLDEPLETFIPAFGRTRVASFDGGRMELVAPARAITIHDLLRHTSGLTYEFFASPLQDLYAEAELARRDLSNADYVEVLAALPLLCQPGTEWNYGRSIEVLGRVVEVASGETLGAFLERHILAPLGMHDTGFHAAGKDDRLAQPFAHDRWSGLKVELFDMGETPRFEGGGAGLVSTAPDYARFAQMLLNGGELHGRRLIGSRTLRFMTANHLDAATRIGIGPLLPGFGFGLGFAVRLQAGVAPFPGSVGQYYWNGATGTQFFADPAEDLWAILMMQAPGQRDHLRGLFRTLVYAALDD